MRVFEDVFKIIRLNRRPRGEIRHNFEFYLHNNYTTNYYDSFIKLKP